MTGKITTEIELKPFKVPDYVWQKMPPGYRQGGFLPQSGIELNRIHWRTLGEMCDRFKEEVFKKAGYNVPDSY